MSTANALPRDVRSMGTEALSRAANLLRLAFLTGAAGRPVHFTITDEAQPKALPLKVSAFLEVSECLDFRTVVVCAATGERICCSLWSDRLELDPETWSMEYASMQDDEGRQLPPASVGGSAA